MPQRTVAIASQLGLHARPASLFVQAVNGSGLPVMIAREGRDPVDARSVLAVMALGAGHGETVTLSCEEQENADKVLDELAEMLSRELDS
ncbi:HPr family phosphocarrier protein [Glycomyces fuscus]|nr:HPr family phosphocarrier protein [Glycomyces fuscus]